MEPNYEEADEKCLVRLQNYREPPQIDQLTENNAPADPKAALTKDNNQSKMSQPKVDEEAGSKMDTVSDTSSQRAIKQIESFELEKLSQRVICLRTTNPEAFEGTLMVQHNEAVFQVRKHIIEKAKNFWKEAIALNTNQTLGLSAIKQKQMDTLFEQNCIGKLGYELGEQYEDQNMRVTFKTFLKHEDQRLEE